MGYADVSSCAEEVVNVARVQAAIWNPERRRRGMEDCRISPVTETGLKMVIHRPAAVSNEIVESAFGFDILLCQDIVTDITSALTFARQELYPFQHQIVGAVVAAVLDMVPYAEDDFK